MVDLSILTMLAFSVVGSPFAVQVVDYSPAPGQFVNSSMFNDPARALGSPVGAGTAAADNTSQVTLGGFGGSITLGFDHRVMNHAANPMGLDCIVFGNAFWVGGNPQRCWAETAHIEISRDDNGNGLPDDAWHVIPGTHILDPIGQYEVQLWDNDGGTSTPPANTGWYPPGAPSPMMTSAYRLPPLFELPIVENPEASDPFDPNSTAIEGIYGYADYSPTLLLGDLDGDNNPMGAGDDPAIAPELFYTVPDDPMTVGVSPGCGGGDAFDIAWAIDPATGAPSDLDGFDFIRITTAVNAVAGILGELSAEVDAVADVYPPMTADLNGDGNVNIGDFSLFSLCFGGAGLPPATTCPVTVDADLDFDGDVDLGDFSIFSLQFSGN